MKTKQPIAFLSGDEAIAQGAYEAGLSFAASYPGTPATEIIQSCAQFAEVDAQWSINEKVAFEVAYAAAVAGRRSLFAAKHVGLNVAMDGLMTSAYTGVNAGFVIITGDDPGLHSSQNEQDNRRIAAFAKMPLIEPSSPAQAKEYIKIAFEISEQFDIPVLFRITTRVAHSKENMTMGKRIEVPQKPFTINAQKYVMVPGMAYYRHLDLEQRLVKLTEYAEKSELNKIEFKSADVGFVASGVSALYVKEMYPEASLLSLGMAFPFPQEKVKQFAKQVKQLYVIEELEPIIEDEVKKLGLAFVAKDISFRVGELKPEYLPLILAKAKKPVEDRGGRKPRLCDECPHTYAYEILAKMDVVVAGDIGCYSLGALPPYGRLHTLLCMGASVTFLESFSKILDKKVIGVIGDSTFVHTGIAGLINAAYNQVKGLLIILDNSTTAMTGGQPHPATGFSIKGEKTKKLDIAQMCTACGADNVDTISPRKQAELQQLIEQRVSENALSVIIVRAGCKLMRSPEKTLAAYQKAFTPVEI